MASSNMAFVPFVMYIRPLVQKSLQGDLDTSYIHALYCKVKLSL
jgi:hypothetical protein